MSNSYCKLIVYLEQIWMLGLKAITHIVREFDGNISQFSTQTIGMN